MTPQEFLNFLNGKQRKVQELINRTLPIRIGATAKAHFDDNFRQGGFVDGGLHKWQPSKRLSQVIVGKRGKPLKQQPAASRYGTLLSGRENLRRNTKSIPGNGEVKIINDTPYAAAHNEGTNNAGRGHKTKLPKRQFIGESKELNDKAKQVIETEVRRIFNS